MEWRLQQLGEGYELLKSQAEKFRSRMFPRLCVIGGQLLKIRSKDCMSGRSQEERSLKGE